MSTTTVNAASLREEIETRRARREALQQQLLSARESLASLESAAARALADGLPSPDLSQSDDIQRQIDALSRAITMLDADVKTLEASHAEATLEEVSDASILAQRAVTEAADALNVAIEHAIADHIAGPSDQLQRAMKSAYAANEAHKRAAAAIGRDGPPPGDPVQMALRGGRSEVMLLGVQLVERLTKRAAAT